MKLYHNGEAWQLPGQQDRKAERADVPNNPEALAAWLNERAVPCQAVAAQLATEITDWVEQGCEEPPQDLIERVTKQPRVAGFCDACGRSAAGTLKLSCGHDLDELGAWLEDVQLDQLWMLQRAAELIRERVTRLGATIEGGSVQ